MAYKYKNVRITAGVIEFPANDIVISGTGIPAGYRDFVGRDSYDSGSFRNSTDITLLCLLTFKDRDSGNWKYGWKKSLTDGYPEAASVSLSPGASFGYKIHGNSGGGYDDVEYLLTIGHTDHPLVNIAGGVWNGYLYEVV